MKAMIALALLAASPTQSASASAPPHYGKVILNGDRPISDADRLQGACATVRFLIADLAKQRPSSKMRAAMSEAVIIQSFVCVRHNSN
jgi:hypothetical protein